MISRVGCIRASEKRKGRGREEVEKTDKAGGSIQFGPVRRSGPNLSGIT
jgi:hypothetical protein